MTTVTSRPPTAVVPSAVLTAVAAAAVLAGCASEPEIVVLSPQVTADTCRLAADYSMQQNGHTLLILVDGGVYEERYGEEWSPATPHPLASGTKSFFGPLAAAAVQDGLLELDEPACGTLTEWAGDPRKSRITVRQLLDFTSGLDPMVVPSEALVATTDVYRRALGMPAIEEPGAVWMYGGTHLAAFGELLARKLAPQRVSVREYLDIRLLKPLNIEMGSWTRDGAGNMLLSSGVAVTARHWARYGEMIRRGGTDADGRRLIDADLLAECFRGTAAHGGYGLTWWLQLVDDEGVLLPGDFRMAAGVGKQQLYVIPSLGVTAVRQGDSPDFSNAQFLARLLYGRPAEELAGFELRLEPAGGSAPR